MVNHSLHRLSLLSFAVLLFAACGGSASEGNGQPPEPVLGAGAAASLSDSQSSAAWARSTNLQVAAVSPAAKRAGKTLAERIVDMPPNSGLSLPPSTVIALDRDMPKGPAPRDYSNRMVYANQRQTALYLGSGHNTHRRNDVWEYHLASNTWQQLFPSDGGSHKPLLSLLQGVFWQRKQIAKNGYSAQQESIVQNAREWWKSNARFEGGRITTRYGGPLLSFHTWDGIVFDDSVGKLLWAVGANWLPSAEAQALLTDQPLSSVQSKLLPNLSPMWSFDPETQQYSQLQYNGPGPGLRGMGSSLVYLPDHKKTLYYSAASNVTPGEFVMYSYDAKGNRWEQLKPNGGASIQDLVLKQRVAPFSEKQMAYSPQHQLVVAVRNKETFTYDLRQNRWDKVGSDDRIDGHDARSVFVFDEAAGVFLLFNPGNKDAMLAEFLPEERRWNVLQAGGDPPDLKGYRQMGYYDSTFKRLVVRIGSARMWVYRR